MAKDVLTKIQEYFEGCDQKMFNNNSDFDIDLEFGQIYEKSLALILHTRVNSQCIRISTQWEKMPFFQA